MAETTPANIADELSDEFNSSIWTFYQTNLSARTRKEYLNIIRNFTKLTKTDPLKLTKEAAECYINELNARYTQKKLSYNTLVMRISVMRSLCEYIRYRREQQSISYYNYFNDIIVPDQDKTLLEENLPTDSEINALLELAADADDDTAFLVFSLAGSYQDAKISFQRIEKILKSPDEEKGEQGIDSIQKVECKDFSLRHGSHMLLDHCSITFYRGRIYGLYGQNGTGKTTFLNALIGLFSGETSGIVSYNGIAIDRLNMPLLRRQKISYVEQTPVMLNMSVKAFLNFGIEQSQSVAETQKMLIEMLEIDDLLTKDINENGNNLSGGEKQKLSIVRALSKESFLILLDEPTSALDKDSIEKLMTLLKQRKMQAIILLVSHDQKVLEQCDEVIDISDLRGN